MSNFVDKAVWLSFIIHLNGTEINRVSADCTVEEIKTNVPGHFSGKFTMIPEEKHQRKSSSQSGLFSLAVREPVCLPKCLFSAHISVTFSALAC